MRKGGNTCEFALTLSWDMSRSALPGDARGGGMFGRNIVRQVTSD